jgi:hypothetical protein
MKNIILLVLVLLAGCSIVFFNKSKKIGFG